MAKKKKARTKRKPIDPFSRLTWEDLEEWAGNRIVIGGRTYHRRGAVQNLVRTTDGALLAWVQGSRRYATRVSNRVASSWKPSAPVHTGIPASMPWPWC